MRGALVAHQDLPLESLGTRISEQVVRIYLDTFGKGPLHSTTFVNGDVITTLLREVFTPAEKFMVGEGKIETVLATRMHWQRVTESRFKADIARVTGRNVASAVSGFNPERDLASEVFVLEPR